jgi:NADH dehydrogenase FAD-containing subunit
LYDAHCVAKSILHSLKKQPAQPYAPKQPVSVIPVGAEWAAVEWGKIHFSGKPGWLLRSAADWIGFNDLQPWWKASEQWLTEFGSQEECVTCTVANQQGPADILQRFGNK